MLCTCSYYSFQLPKKQMAVLQVKYFVKSPSIPNLCLNQHLLQAIQQDQLLEKGSLGFQNVT